MAFALEREVADIAAEMRELQHREAELRAKRNEGMLELRRLGRSRAYVADLVGISRVAVGRWEKYGGEDS